MTSGGHGLQITDDYSKQECLVLTPTMISLKQKYFSDLPYPRYQVKRSSGPMMVASCWSLLRNFLKTSLSSSKACPWLVLWIQDITVVQVLLSDARKVNERITIHG